MDTREYLNVNSEDERIDFHRYLSLFISNWYWFAGALFIAITIAYGINRYAEEVFTVQSSLLIKDEQYGGGFAEMDKIIPGGDIFRSTQNLENEIGILRSFNLNYRVMRSLPEFHVVYVGVGRRGIAESRLYKTCPFIVKYDSLETQPIGLRLWVKVISPTRYLLSTEDRNYNHEYSFGETVDLHGMRFSLLERKGGRQLYESGGSNKYYFYFISPAILANQYRSKLSVTPIKENATLVTLSVSGPAPQQEADYLNKLMEVYNEQGLEYKNETAKKTIEFIDEQLALISDSLTIAENDMENFRLSNNLVDLTIEGSMALQKYDRFENEKAELSLQLQYYQYLLTYVETQNESGSIVSPSVLGSNIDPVLVSSVEELADLQQRRKQISFTVREEVPAVKLMEDRIAQVRASIKDNVTNSINRIKISINDVSSRIADVQKQMGRLPGTERRLIEIQRTFDLNNTVYTFLLEKRAEAGIAKASRVSDNRTIDTANPFNAARIRPRNKRNYMLAFILGFVLPAVAIVIIDLLNNKIIDKKDIEKVTRTPILGYISHSNYSTEIPVIEKPGSTLSESFRSIRTSLRYFITEEKPRVIGISSTISGEGKTFVAVNLAAIISMLGKKTLLVGLDLRKPRIHRILGLDNKVGMSTYLSNNSTFDEIIQPTRIENLWYTASGPIPPNPAELIERTTMAAFLEEARKQFDYIILDTPPVAIVTDALLLSSHADIMLFVVRQRYSSRSTLHLIEEIHRNREMNNAGIIVNDISMSGYYGYGLRYGYTMGYAYGYNYGYKYYGQAYYGRKDDQAGEYYTDD
ncbi:MAG TPA: polysaccharide biosynthesis tyrosine autokinase [Bacteroidales bacterium]|nr:polysaccharide biosynthesis tyrosine autokinase [Bacteroidales bacterium]